MKLLVRVFPAAGLLVATAASAQTPAPAPTPGPAPVAVIRTAPVPAPVSPVKLTLDIGAVNATGNTNVTTLNLGDAFEYKGKSGGFAEFANVVYGRIGDSTTAEQIRAGLRVDHRLWAVVFGWVGVTYERKDRKST